MLFALQDVAMAAGVFLHHRDAAHALRRDADLPVVAILVIDVTAYKLMKPFHEEVLVTDHRPNGTAKIEIGNSRSVTPDGKPCAGSDSRDPRDLDLRLDRPGGERQGLRPAHDQPLSIEVAAPRSRARSCSMGKLGGQ